MLAVAGRRQAVPQMATTTTGPRLARTTTDTFREQGMRLIAPKKNNDGLLIFILATAVTLVAGYAAHTRFDRWVGPPESPPDSLRTDAAEAGYAHPAVEPDGGEREASERAALSESLQALVAEERSLPLPGQATGPGSFRQSTGVVAEGTRPVDHPPKDVVARAATSIAEAELLLRQRGYAVPAAERAHESRAHQARMERISRLREKLGHTAVRSPSRDGVVGALPIQ